MVSEARPCLPGGNRCIHRWTCGTRAGSLRRRSLRGVPSASAVFRYLEGFHEVGEEERREEHRAFIPVANGVLRGLWKVNGDMVGFICMVGFMQRHAQLDRPPQEECGVPLPGHPGTAARSAFSRASVVSHKYGYEDARAFWSSARRDDL